MTWRVLKFVLEPCNLPLAHEAPPRARSGIGCLLHLQPIDMIDQWHASVKLAGLIDWEVFEREWVGFFPSGKGQPATELRLVAGLLYLQHGCRLSDEAAVARWVENP